MCSRSSRRASAAVITVVALMLALLPAVGAAADRDAVCGDAPVGVFNDVPSSNLHAANIDCVAANGIAVGVGGGSYDPTGPVVRGQMASYLVNLVEVAGEVSLEVPGGPIPFADIRSTTHEANIRLAAHLRITSGRTPTTYEPRQTVTRAQMATFVAQAIEAAGGQLPTAPRDAFTDDVGSIHETSINAIAAEGIVRGVGNGRYDPGAEVTRAQMATYLVNAAIFLHSQGLWAGGQTDDGAPSLVLVLRADDDRFDLLELRFDRAVDLADTPGAVAIYDEANDLAVTSASPLPATEQPGGSRVLVATDADLTAGSVYWLRIEEGLVVAGDGTPNEAEERAFTFSVAVPSDPGDGGDPGNGGDDGGDGGSDGGSDGGTVDAPTITSVVTAPDDNLILVTFSEPVTCTDTSAGRAAWSFTNQSVIETGSTQAQGPPLAVDDLGPSRPEVCGLQYDDIENGDFGTISYTQPSATADQMRDADGHPVESVTGLEVRDGKAPLMTGISASEGPPTQIRMLFTEPIACSSLSTGDFDLVVNTNRVLGQIEGFGCVGFSDNPTMNFAMPVFREGDEVQLVVLGSISSQGGNQTVSLGTTRTTTATS